MVSRMVMMWDSHVLISGQITCLSHSMIVMTREPSAARSQGVDGARYLVSAILRLLRLMLASEFFEMQS